jgi:hypothetical protein
MVATAGHCVDTTMLTNNFGTPTTINDFFIVFGFVVPSVAAPDTATLTFPGEQIYRGTLIDHRLSSTGEDWGLVRLDRPTPYAPLGIRGGTTTIPNGTNLLVVGHPSGLPRKYADDATVRINTNALFFETNLDTYPGNSGSAVFNRNTREVEGIHVRGRQTNNFEADTKNNCWRSIVVLDNAANTNGGDVTRITLPDLQVQIPRTVFVDSSYVGPDTGGSSTQPFNPCCPISPWLLRDLGGSRAHPHRTLNEGLNDIRLAGGVALVLHPGQYPEKVTIHTPMRIYNGQPRSGVVRIGQ